MNKEFIPYEQALALKELGFNEPCLGYYNSNNDFMFFSDIKTCNTNSEFGFYPTVPTFSQVFKFFRDEYNIQGYVYSSTIRGNKEGKRFSDYCWYIKGIDISINVDSRDMDGVSYEEAELVCLRKLIEIVKNETVRNRG